MCTESSIVSLCPTLQGQGPALWALCRGFGTCPKSSERSKCSPGSRGGLRAPCNLFESLLCHAPLPCTTCACDSNQDADEIDLPEGFAIGVCFSVGKMAPSQIATCNMQKPSPQGKETTTSLFGARASVSFRSQPTKRSKSRKGCHLVAW